MLSAIIAHSLAGAAGAQTHEDYGPLQRLAAGVYVQRGADAAASVANRGAVANLGVLVGASGVIVVNTGSSSAHGRALLAAVARLTDRPVLLAIDTQANPDQVLGNAAFAQRGIPILAHRDTDTFMRVHCDACVGDVRAKADSDALEATEVNWPTRLIEGSQTLSVGGRTLQILALGWTKQPGCLAVFDTASGVLFAGDMASFGVVPQAQFARVGPWIEALDQLQALKPKQVVPSHGAPGSAQVLADTRDYLQQLLAGTRAAYQRGDGLMETIEQLDLPQFRSWALYQPVHRRNVHFTYLQVEEQDLKGR